MIRQNNIVVLAVLFFLSCSGGGTPTKPSAKDDITQQDIEYEGIEVEEVFEDGLGDLPSDLLEVEKEGVGEDIEVTPQECENDSDCMTDRQVGSCIAVWCDKDVGKCMKGMKPDFTSCQVESKCEKDGLCISGMCVGTPIICDDSNPCTDDKCDPNQGCIFVPNQAVCDDNNTCTQKDQCKDGVCVGEENICMCDKDEDCVQYEDGDLCKGPLYCKDGYCEIDHTKDVLCPEVNIQCVDPYCEPSTGKCAIKPKKDGEPCDDSNICTQGETCQKGECVANPLIDPAVNIIVCDDKNICTDDICDPKNGCIFVPNNRPCDDGNHCTVKDKCQEGKCIGIPTEGCGCQSDEECAKWEDDNLCNGTLKCKNGKCVIDPMTIVVCPQEDLPVCFKSVCDPKTGVCNAVPVENGAKCDDLDPCTLLSECKEGKCVSIIEVSCDDNNPCTDDICEKGKGCIHEFNTIPCDDGDNCTESDVCKEGVCKGIKKECTDGNECTDDFCDQKEGCIHIPTNKPCDDKDICTENDICFEGQCVGTKIICDDGNPCTDDICDPKLGCQFINNLSACDDQDPCTVDDMCFEGICVGGGTLTCDDGNPCTDDKCEPNVGCVFTNNTKPCDDMNACTKGDVCKDGICTPGEQITCNDDNICTTDKCDPVKGCVFENNVLPCNDNDACTTNDQCKEGKCIGSPIICDDQNPCTEDACNKEKGCVFSPISGSCEDGNKCTENDHCVEGKCVGGNDVVCNDDNPCTLDTCSPQEGCKYTNTTGPCDDQDPCTVNDYCLDGKCVSGSPKICDDGNPCTKDTCDKEKGCIFEKLEDGTICDDNNQCTDNDVCKDGKCVGEGIVCDDGNPCTDDACTDPQQGCIYTPNNKPCDDGNACTSLDRCSNGECKGEAFLLCDDFNPCTDDACDPKVGCVYKNNNAQCDDGNACTIKDQCVDGKCKGGAFILCDDFNPCTDDSCDPKTGCVYKNNTLPCDDGNLCTTQDQCKDGKCVGGAPPNCDDGNICTNDKCEPALGCIHTYNTLPCDDNNKCTKDDTCKNGQCIGTKITCDDGNICTTDSCDPAKGCVYQPNNLPCDDGNPCTTKDQCLDGKCVGGQELICDDKNPCTSDSCIPPIGCVFVPNQNPCDDGDACTVGDQCKDSKCMPGAPRDCNDNNICTDDKCDKTLGCIYTFNTLPCDDSNQCTTKDTCNQGKCVGGPPLVCDDKNICTTDSCDPLKGCIYTPNTLPCDDGNACTVGDVCKDTKCIPGSAKDCNDNNPCTDDSCDPTVGCVYKVKPDGTPCDDGNKCSINDQCIKGKCVGEGVNCDDGNPCTDDRCDDPSVGCYHVFNSNPCDDGNVCTTGDKCVLGQCKGQGTLNCDDGNVCTDDKCDPKEGCFHIFNTLPCDDKNACTEKDTCSLGKCIGSPIKCDDQNICTDDSCDPSKGCVFTPNTKPCDDGNKCTTNDVCKDGKCVGGPPLDCNDNNVCTDDLCDSNLGCIYKFNTNPCDDNNKCTTNDQCKDGKCVGGPPPNCDDNNICTDDSCDPAVGCVYKPNTKPCDDQNACTTNDQCKDGKCVGGPPPNCDDGNICTDDLCDKLIGCYYKFNNNPCDDQNKCTTNDICKNGQCVGGPPLNCDDNNVCTTDSCDPQLGCIYSNNNLPCDDGDKCTVQDYCSQGKCMPGQILDCNDNNPCTQDSCDPAIGCVNNPLPDETQCNDFNPCTTGDVCKGGQCVGSGLLNCDDYNKCTVDWCQDYVGCQHAALSDLSKCGKFGLCYSGQCVEWEQKLIEDNKFSPTVTRFYESGRPETNGKYYISGGDNSGELPAVNYPRIYELDEKSLTVNRVFNGSISGWFYSQERRLASGSLGDSARYTMGFFAPIWTNQNIPVFSQKVDILALTSQQLLGSTYYFAGGKIPVDSKIMTFIDQCEEGTNGFQSKCNPLLLVRREKDCTQKQVEIRGAFSVSTLLGEKVFFVGYEPDKNIIIATYNGNQNKFCSDIPSYYYGEVYYDAFDQSPDYDLVENITPSGPGALNDIHGLSMNNIWAVGEKGTVYWFSGQKWTRIDVSKQIPEFNIYHNATSVLVDTDTGLHIVGLFDAKGCYTPFYLHGFRKEPGGEYIFNTYYLVYGLTACDLNLIGISDITRDPATGNIYVVGWAQSQNKEVWGLILRWRKP